MVENNQSNNKNIKEYLDYYKKLDSPGFAVLLKGEWGCGKTYFIKKYFKLEEKEHNQQFGQSPGQTPKRSFRLWRSKTVENIDNKSSKAIYISLYGINDIESIDSLIFQKLHPFWTSKEARLFGNIGRGLLKASLKIDLNGDKKDDGTLSLSIPDIKILEEFANLEDKILIFDDLERCRIEINDLLGYINYFVEHQALKVIIVADEDKIKGDIIQSFEAKSFDKIKEKVIGKRFTLSTSFDKAFSVFLNLACKEKLLKNFLLQKQNFLKDLFKVGNTNNLRTLKSIIYEFERIYTCLPEKILTNLDFLHDVLKSLTILSIESRLGNFPEDMIKKLGDIYSEYCSNIASNYNKKPENSESNEAKKYEHEKYFVFCHRLQYKYIFSFEYFLPNYLWWGNFFEHGLIDKQALHDSFFNSKYCITQDSELWLTIYHFDRIQSDEIFNKLINRAIDKIKNQEQFDHIGIFLHIISCLIFFSEESLISENTSMLSEIAEGYIQHFSTTDEDRFFKETLAISNLSSGIYFKQYKQLVFVSDDNLYFKKIKLIIVEKMRLIYDKRFLRQINQILDDNFFDNHSGMNLAQLIHRKNDEIDYFLPKEAFLSKIDVQKLTNYFLKISFSGQKYILYAVFDYFNQIRKYSSNSLFIDDYYFLILLIYEIEESSKENNKLNSYKVKNTLYKYLTPEIFKPLEDRVESIVNAYISIFNGH